MVFTALVKGDKRISFELTPSSGVKNPIWLKAYVAGRFNVPLKDVVDVQMGQAVALAPQDKVPF